MTAVATAPATGTSRRAVEPAAVRRALATVVDPELDEPVTDLGFVRSVEVLPGGRVVVHLRLPTSFCAPNFAYLMASDARDAVATVPGVSSVVVELDDHHDSDLINRGLAADAGYRGTFGHEAHDSLDELRATFRRKAHTAAMERSLTAWLRADRDRRPQDVASVRLGDLPDDATTAALRRRRREIGLGAGPLDLVLVDAAGRAVRAADAVLQLRLARSTRISVDGNAHFCRGLLRTRYPGSGDDQTTRHDDPDLEESR